jgi:protein tyrosine/serine phosphatase
LVAAATGVVACQWRGETTDPRVSPSPVAGASGPSRESTATAHSRWAQPIDRPGLPNLHQVSPALYRGAQPTAAGLAELKKMGVKTDINLRSFHSDHDMLGDTGLAYGQVPMKTWHLENEDIVRFLKLATDPVNQPVFVHCQHGADRTGVACAVFRIVVQGWSKDRAIDEMTHGGFGFHPIWQNLVDYIRNLDVEQVRRQAGLKSQTVDPPS